MVLIKVVIYFFLLDVETSIHSNRNTELRPIMEKSLLTMNNGNTERSVFPMDDKLMLIVHLQLVMASIMPGIEIYIWLSIFGGGSIFHPSIIFNYFPSILHLSYSALGVLDR